MCSVVQDKVGFVCAQEVFDLVACEVHGSGKKMDVVNGDFRGDFGALGEAVEVGDGDWREGDEVRVVVEMFELKDSFLGHQESDSMASGSELVGEVNVWGDVAHGKPWEHG